MSRDGSKFPGMFPGGIPPMGGGSGQPMGLQVAAPQNDTQLIAHMAAEIVAQLAVGADLASSEQRSTMANLAALLAIETLGCVCYHAGRGTINSAVGAANRQGQSDRMAAIEAEKPQEPDGKIITGEG